MCPLVHAFSLAVRLNQRQPASRQSQNFCATLAQICKVAQIRQLRWRAKSPTIPSKADARRSRLRC